ncbi:hypothetical protein JAAARDRAFT_125013, partial [Jaapia argillacea MUCL 33604]
LTYTQIQCDNVHCKFSPSHPPDCVPPQCTRKCWQYHQSPQQFVPRIDNWCPTCLARGVDSNSRQ